MLWLLMKYSFDPKSSIIALTVTLIGIKNEKKKIEMAFDTGATYNLIPWDVAESLGYEPAFSKKKVNITTASGIEKSPLINVECISVLGKKAKNIECIIHDLPETSRVDGLLGLSFIRHFKIFLDFKKGVLEIE